jgi:hypothetical protein
VQVEDYQRHLKVWQKKADTFAKYYLCNFRPLENVYSGEHNVCNPDDFTWDALCTWVQSMESSPRLVDRLRVAAMFNHIYGFRSKSEHSNVLNAYRMRERTMWSDEQKAENKEIYSGFKTYRQDMKETDEAGDDMGGSTCHVFRTQDVTEVYKELRYCSEQMQTINFVFQNIGEGGSSEYTQAEHSVIALGSATDVTNRSNALRHARPKKASEVTADEGSEDDSELPFCAAAAVKEFAHEETTEKESPPSPTEYIESRNLSEGQKRVVDRLRQYFDQVGTTA